MTDAGKEVLKHLDKKLDYAIEQRDELQRQLDDLYERFFCTRQRSGGASLPALEAPHTGAVVPTLHGTAMSEPTVETCDLCAQPGNTLVTCDECQDDVRASALEEAARVAESTDIHKFYAAVGSIAENAKAIIARRIRALKSRPTEPAPAGGGRRG